MLRACVGRRYQGVISSMGTYKIGLLAKSTGKPFYVVAESHKFVRLHPPSGTDLPINSMCWKFETEREEGKPEQGKRKKGRDKKCTSLL